jgi:hypothetical protein
VLNLTDSGLTDFDLYLFGEGKHERIHDLSTAPEGARGYPYSLRLNLPPLGAMFVIGPT